MLNLSLKGATVCVAIMAVGIAGCTTVPSLEGTRQSIPVNQIVARVKCELNHAVAQVWNDPDYEWFKKWGASVDLTLIVNDQAGVTPNITLIKPFHSAVIPLVGTIPRSFNLGIGASATTQATTTEILSFSVSLAELRKDIAENPEKYRGCELGERIDLDSNLRLDDFIRSNLEPVHYKLLKLGVHPRVKAAAVVAKAQANNSKNADKLLGVLDPSQVQQLKEPLTIESARTITDFAAKLRSQLKEKKLQQEKQQPGEQRLQQEKPQSDLDQAIKALDDINKDTTVAVSALKKPPPPPKINDPIDTISKQIQFVVVWSANVTPNWTLVYFKGPAASSGPFGSLSKTDTHSLNIVLGPMIAGVQSLTAQNIRNTLQLSTGISNTLRTTIVPLQ